MGYLKSLSVNELCPRGWAWCIGDCDCAPDEGDCNDCRESLSALINDMTLGQIAETVNKLMK